MFHRGFRGSRRRSGPRPVVQSQKVVLNFLDASFSAGFSTEQLAVGVDAVAAGQTSVTDANIPTGSMLKFIEVQFAVNNAAATAAYVTCSLQYKLVGQSFIDPSVVGGSKQRNQVLHMDLFSVGQNQNSTHKFKFKIPKGFQRIREGMSWGLTWNNSQTVNRRALVIYKYYR